MSAAPKASLPSWLRRIRASTPAGTVILALVVGFLVYQKLPLGPGAAQPSLTWRDLEGGRHGGSDFGAHRATVLFFMSAQCPCADAYAGAMAAIAKQFTPQGARFFAVFSNGDESPADIRRYLERRQLGFPAVKDDQGNLSRQVGSAVTPSAVIIDSLRNIAYHGAIGEPLKPDVAATVEDCGPLTAALTAVIAGRDPSRLVPPLLGCAIVGASIAGLPPIEPHDNQVPAGRLENGVLQVRLVAETGVWRPEREDGAGLPMHAFREEGGPLRVPAPLIRAPEGTEIRLTIRNAISASPLHLRFPPRAPEAPPVPVKIAPGEEREIRWKADRAGTFVYWAGIAEPVFEFPHGRDVLLSGGLIVDPAGTTPDPAERIFVLHEFLETGPRFTAEIFDVSRLVVTLNGLSWPYTERLTYQVGERVRWRLLNASFVWHPMHLHGFYFEVASRNDGARETRYAPTHREKSVTELMTPGGSSSLEWTPDRVGRWVFHCHMAVHFSSGRRLRGIGKGPSAADEHTRHALEDMSGLVLGIDVQSNVEPPSAPTTGPAREFVVRVREHPKHYGEASGLSFFPEESERVALPAEPTIPGPPIVLTRGERARIKVVNEMPRATAVHWHGIELESYFDGVVGWGGHSRNVTPSIGPGRSFVAEMTPPRAGTFIYHTHFDDDRQLSSGLYGALIVLEPGERYDPERDRVFVMGQGAPGRSDIRLNGSLTPAAMRLKPGQAYRFRFINITADSSLLSVRLTADERVVAWRAIAKDGATLPPARAIRQPADQRVTVGETRDFEFIPEQPGELKLTVHEFNGLPVAQMSLLVQ